MLAARVYIVRHGETDENRLGIMQGQLDTNLNAIGIEQAQLTADALEMVPFTKAFSSDLKRAVKTAEMILKRHPHVELEQDPELRERNLGDWQGRKSTERGFRAPANAEPVGEFTGRAVRWWKERIIPCTTAWDGHGEPAHILVVSHGGLIGRLIVGLLESGRVEWATGSVLTTKCFNASISVLELQAHGGGEMVSYSDTTHLNVDFVESNADVQE
ncbi:Probable phosphatase [Sparassis crispa]|uniref:Probable phosphatase n=1 Tax=Sparassis crispa TaxID=139825 RepID=A0A401GIZ7_9APHY|nr:Probable phosphatase [Sparassis crispa]GBE82142.1 Probable phosphatase [Sparassis crispa]